MSTWGNQEHLAVWLDDPWYPAIKRTDERLEEIVPGYQIAQIKEKFGGLRYYIYMPENTSEKAFNEAYRVIGLAEAWVDGFEEGRKSK